MTDIVLFGVTGDLSKKKILPTLARISQFKNIRVIGFGRKKNSQNEFKKFIEDVVQKFGLTFQTALPGFEAVYIESEIGDSKGYDALKSAIHEDAVIHLALPPEHQLTVVKKLVEGKVLVKGNTVSVAFEKPFGSSLRSAKVLNTFLKKHLIEEQIIRVDHYAGKETLLDLESAGRIGLPAFVGSKNRINKVTVRFNETITVGARGQFYDSVGAIVDVAQNHLLHMLITFITSFGEQCVYESGKNLGTCIISSSVTSSLGQIRGIIAELLDEQGVPKLAQYKGFKEIEGVSKKSTTETYFKFFVRMKNPSEILKKRKKHILPEVANSILKMYSYFKNTKFEFEGGKGLDTQDVSIEASFSEGTYKVMINRNCGKEAYDEIFTSLIEKNLNRFVTQEQVEAGWRIVEAVKKRAGKKIVEYNIGTHPFA